jgi:hypothetical protein
MMTGRFSYVVPFLAIVLLLLAASQTYGSQEGMLGWSLFSIESEGIGSSGPVTISGKQNATGVTAMTIKAFGRVYELGKEQLDLLKPMRVNGMQLSYEGGFKDQGGRTLYIQLSSGFFVSGIKARKFVVMKERGDVVVQEPRSP